MRATLAASGEWEVMRESLVGVKVDAAEAQHLGADAGLPEILDRDHLGVRADPAVSSVAAAGLDSDPGEEVGR
jgi:hypothetical protein